MDEIMVRSVCEKFLAMSIAMREDSHYHPRWTGWTPVKDGLDRIRFAREHASPEIVAQYDKAMERYAGWDD